MRFEVIGDDVWLAGYRVAKLTKEAPPSVQQAARDKLEPPRFYRTARLPMKEARDG